MTDVEPVMPASFRSLLAQLELLSHGSTQSWNKSGSQSEPDWTPTGENFPPHERLRIDWECAQTDDRRREVEKEAEAELNAARVRTVKEPTPEPVHLRNAEILKRGEGWEPNEVARHFRIAVREVIALRTNAGLDPATGKPWAAEEDPVSQAHRLAGDGLKVRQIARYQRVEPSTVTRRLRRSA